jgi:hypothetical protein
MCFGRYYFREISSRVFHEEVLNIAWGDKISEVPGEMSGSLRFQCFFLQMLRLRAQRLKMYDIIVAHDSASTQLVACSLQGNRVFMPPPGMSTRKHK